jgi:NADH-quinone oxidoreductase subunit J
VLFLFVVMLLNLRQENFAPQRQLATKIAAVLVGLLVLAQFLALIHGAFGAPAAVPEDFGGYRQVGTALFTDYVLAFEATSLLLLAAMVGAVILAKRKID